MRSPRLLLVEGLTAGYEGLKVLFDVSIAVSSREIVVIIGPNGSGKTTLLKAIFGLASVYSGRILYEGEEIVRLAPHRRAKIGIAYLPQLENVFTNLTVEENLKLLRYTLKRDEFEDRLQLALSIFPELKERMKQRVQTLSGGERQFLALAIAVARKSKLLMLDEPISHLSPKLASTVLAKIVELRDKLGLGILLVEQNVMKALEVGDRAYVLVDGRCVLEKEAKALRSTPELGKLFLGVRTRD